MTGKGDKDTRKNHKRYNEAVYWKLKELKSLAKYVEGTLEGATITVLNTADLKANRVKGKQLMSFIDFKADYYEVSKLRAQKGKITIELKENK